jgi:hypothetical protein
MKTTLLFSAAILLSAATFAQTTVKNQESVKNVTTIQKEKGNTEVKSAGSGSSSTSVQTNEAERTKQKARTAAEKSKATVTAEKEATIEKVNTTEDRGDEAMDKDATLSANAQSETSVVAEAKDNKAGENAYLTGEATVSSTEIKGQTVKMKSEIKENVNVIAAVVVNTGKQVKTEITKVVVQSNTKVNAAAATTVKAGAAAAHSVKPRPVAVKVDTHVKAISGIRIK